MDTEFYNIWLQFDHIEGAREQARLELRVLSDRLKAAGKKDRAAGLSELLRRLDLLAEREAAWRRRLVRLMED